MYDLDWYRPIVKNASKVKIMFIDTTNQLYNHIISMD